MSVYYISKELITKTIRQDAWQPATPQKVASTVTFTTSTVKTTELNTSVSASVCSQANLTVMLLQACADAKKSYSDASSQSAVSTTNIALKPMEQRSYTIAAKFYRYRYGFKVGATVLDPNLIIDIPYGTVFSTYIPRIAK